MSATRPTSVTLTAWFWIIVGAMMLFSGTMAAIMLNLRPPTTPTPETLPEGYEFYATLFSYLPIIFALQFLVGFIAILSGIALFKLKPWSYQSAKALSWLGLLYLAGFLTLWIYLWNFGGVGPKDRAFGIMGTVMALVNTALMVTPLILILRALQSTKVKTAFGLGD